MTPQQWPSAETIWDFAQNTKSLYDESLVSNTDAELEEHVRHAIVEFNEVMHGFDAATYAGSVENVVTYFKEMRALIASE